MPISNRLQDGLDEVDVIICGGGTAGCTLAGRLARADPNLSILLIEGGQDNSNIPHIQLPALFPQNLVPGSKTTILYEANKSDALAGRSSAVHCGGVLGGGSSVNLMLYSRAQGCDFDAWNTPGWTAKDLVPLMEKIETYHGPGKKTHGHNGPVQVSSRPSQGSKSRDHVIDAAASLGYKIYEDLENPAETNNGFERVLAYITPDGVRADAANAYIHPLMKGEDYSKLHVLTESKVVRVLFDENKRATGVEYTANPQHVQENGDGPERKTTTVNARKLVVLSSGAIGTALTLQRSGVGDRSILEKASVPVVADLKVGAQYDDHTLVPYPFQTNLSLEDTLDGLYSGRMSAEDATKRGLLGWNGVDTHAKFRPTEEEVEALGPKFKQLWDKDYKNNPNKPLLMMATGALFLGDPMSVPAGQYATAAIYSAYDYSVGHVHITGPNLEDPIDFDVGYFTDKDDFDITAHVWGYKKLRTLMRSTEMYTGELALGHPQFAEGSKAANASDTDAKNVVKDPEYSAEDDAAIEKHVRATAATCWHSLGTCPMRAQEKGGVVDPSLNVYGVKGLKCVDLSIIGQVAANTNNTAYVVGEKGAEIIIRELGLLN